MAKNNKNIYGQRKEKKAKKMLGRWKKGRLAAATSSLQPLFYGKKSDFWSVKFL